MSRVDKCIDNGPMEGFWGILKCEMYYLNHFETYEKLASAVERFVCTETFHENMFFQGQDYARYRKSATQNFVYLLINVEPITDKFAPKTQINY